MEATVLIVDDEEAVRTALAMLIESEGLTARSFASGDELLAADLPEGPACVLLDLRMPGMGGLEVQARLSEIAPELPVIFLTGFADVADAVTALKRGALDFFEKPGFDREKLLKTVHAALDTHGKSLSQAEGRRVLEARLRTLSPRELEVARMAAAGKANKVIAAELGISERTVEIHRGRAMRKLGLRTAPELIRLESQLTT